MSQVYPAADASSKVYESVLGYMSAALKERSPELVGKLYNVWRRVLNVEDDGNAVLETFRQWFFAVREVYGPKSSVLIPDAYPTITKSAANVAGRSWRQVPASGNDLRKRESTEGLLQLVPPDGYQPGTKSATGARATPESKAARPPSESKAARPPSESKAARPPSESKAARPPARTPYDSTVLMPDARVSNVATAAPTATPTPTPTPSATLTATLTATPTATPTATATNDDRSAPALPYAELLVRLETANAEAIACRQNLQKLRARFEATDKDLKYAREKLDEGKGEASLAVKELKQRAAELARCQAQAQEAYTQSETKLRQALEELARRGEQVEAGRMRVEELQKELEVLRAQAERCEQSRTDSELKVQLCQTERGRLMAYQSQSEVLKADYEKKIEEWKASHVKADKRVRAAKAQRDKLQQQVNSQQQEMSALQEQLASRDRFQTKTKQQLEEKFANLDRTRSLTEQKLERVQQELEQSTADYEAKLTEAEAAHARHASQSYAQAKEMRARITRLESKLAEGTRQWTEMTEAFDRIRTLLKSDNLTMDAQGMSTILDKLMSVQKTEAQLQLVSDQLSAAQTQVRQLEEIRSQSGSASSAVSNELEQCRAQHAEDVRAHGELLSKLKKCAANRGALQGQLLKAQANAEQQRTEWDTTLSTMTASHQTELEQARQEGLDKLTQLKDKHRTALISLRQLQKRRLQKAEAAWNSQLEAHQAREAELQQQIDMLQAELVDTQKQANAKLVNLQGRADALQTSLDACTASLQQAQQSTEATCVEVERQLSACASQSAAVGEQLRTLSGDHQACRAEVDRLTNTLQASDFKVQESATQLAEQSERFMELQQQARDLEQQLNAVRAELGQCREDAGGRVKCAEDLQRQRDLVAELQGEQKLWNERQSELKARLSEEFQRAEALQTRAEACEARLRNDGGVTQQLKQEMNRLTEELSVNKNNMTQCVMDLAAAKQTTQQLESELAQASQTMLELEERADQTERLQSQLDQCGRRLQSCQEQNRPLMAQLSSLLGRIFGQEPNTITTDTLVEAQRKLAAEQGDSAAPVDEVKTVGRSASASTTDTEAIVLSDGDLDQLYRQVTRYANEFLTALEFKTNQAASFTKYTSHMYRWVRKHLWPEVFQAVNVSDITSETWRYLQKLTTSLETMVGQLEKSDDSPDDTTWIKPVVVFYTIVMMFGDMRRAGRSGRSGRSGASPAQVAYTSGLDVLRELAQRVETTADNTDTEYKVLFFRSVRLWPVNYADTMPLVLVDVMSDENQQMEEMWTRPIQKIAQGPPSYDNTPLLQWVLLQLNELVQTLSQDN